MKLFLSAYSLQWLNAYNPSISCFVKQTIHNYLNVYNHDSLSSKCTEAFYKLAKRSPSVLPHHTWMTSSKNEQLHLKLGIKTLLSKDVTTIIKGLALKGDYNLYQWSHFFCLHFALQFPHWWVVLIAICIWLLPGSGQSLSMQWKFCAKIPSICSWTLSIFYLTGNIFQSFFLHVRDVIEKTAPKTLRGSVHLTLVHFEITGACLTSTTCGFSFL